MKYKVCISRSGSKAVHILIIECKDIDHIRPKFNKFKFWVNIHSIKKIEH